jgi:hypothetical protein
VPKCEEVLKLVMLLLYSLSFHNRSPPSEGPSEPRQTADNENVRFPRDDVRPRHIDCAPDKKSEDETRKCDESCAPSQAPTLFRSAASPQNPESAGLGVAPPCFA